MVAIMEESQSAIRNELLLPVGVDARLKLGKRRVHLGANTENTIVVEQAIVKWGLT